MRPKVFKDVFSFEDGRVTIVFFIDEPEVFQFDEDPMLEKLRECLADQDPVVRNLIKNIDDLRRQLYEVKEILREVTKRWIALKEKH